MLLVDVLFLKNIYIYIYIYCCCCCFCAIRGELCIYMASNMDFLYTSLCAGLLKNMAVDKGVLGGAEAPPNSKL